MSTVHPKSRGAQVRWERLKTQSDRDLHAKHIKGSKQRSATLDWLHLHLHRAPLRRGGCQLRPAGETHDDVFDLQAATLDEDILIIIFILARGGGNVTFAAETAADICRKFARGHDMVAIIVCGAGQPLAQKISEIAAGLELACDQAG